MLPFLVIFSCPLTKAFHSHLTMFLPPFFFFFFSKVSKENRRQDSRVEKMKQKGPSGGKHKYPILFFLFFFFIFFFIFSFLIMTLIMNTCGCFEVFSDLNLVFHWFMRGKVLHRKREKGRGVESNKDGFIIFTESWNQCRFILMES